MMGIRHIARRCFGAEPSMSRTLSTIIGHRDFLAGSKGHNIPKYLRDPTAHLPKIIYPKDCKTFDRISNRFSPEFYRELNSMVECHGGVLLREFPLHGISDFSAFVSGIGPDTMQYLAGIALRNQVASNVFTASNEPPCLNIEPHNEMCYKEEWPKLILFFCDIAAPPGSGGETVVADVRDIKAKLDHQLVEKLLRVGIIYHRYFPDRKISSYLCWQENLQCENREQAESYLRQNNFRFEWQEDGCLAFWQVMPAVRRHLATGELIWFNQASAAHASYTKQHPDWIDTDLPDKQYPLHTLYGDGTKIEDEVIQHIRDVSWTCAYGFQMQKGDVLILDNMYIQHGRLSFTDKRRLLTSLIPF